MKNNFETPLLIKKRFITAGRDEEMGRGKGNQ
jgi:hypothetical protein